MAVPAKNITILRSQCLPDDRRDLQTDQPAAGIRRRQASFDQFRKGHVRTSIRVVSAPWGESFRRGHTMPTISVNSTEPCPPRLSGSFWASPKSSPGHRNPALRKAAPSPRPGSTSHPAGQVSGARTATVAGAKEARPTPSKKGEDPASFCHVFVGKTESRQPTRVAMSASNGIRGLLSKKETLNGRPFRLIRPPGLRIRIDRSVERCTGMTSTWTRMTCNLGHVQSKRPCHRIRPGRRAQVMQVPNPQT